METVTTKLEVDADDALDQLEDIRKKADEARVAIEKLNEAISELNSD